ncbi:MAG: potassium channel family protein [Halioglobus sp.]
MKRIDSHNNFFFFTAALVFLLVFSSFVNSYWQHENRILLHVIMFLPQLAAYFSLNLSKRWRRFVALILVLHLAANGLYEVRQSHAISLACLVIILVFFCGMVYTASKQVLRTGGIELNTIAGTIAIYLLLGLIWTVLYLIALEAWPQGLSGLSYQQWDENFGAAAYFSYVTMTTLGYGDITPAVPVIRTLAYLQAITGSFYMAIVVASMVGAFNSRSPKNPKA